MTTTRAIPPVDAWQVESMRVTAFPGDVVPLDRLSWWDDVIGLPPEAVVSKPKSGQYRAHGVFEGRRLLLQIQPGRIDWAATPVVKPEDEEDTVGLPTVGSLSDISGVVTKVVTAWLPLAPVLRRLAFGAVLLRPVGNVSEGQDLIAEYLRATTRINFAGTSDFFFQINRPRMAGAVPGLRINRLMRWSVQVVQQMTVMIASGGTETKTVGEDTVCRLELDINTAPDFGVLPADKLGSVLQELSDLGREIAQKGDVL